MRTGYGAPSASGTSSSSWASWSATAPFDATAGEGRRPSSQTWRTFLRDHAHHLWAADLFTVPTLTFKTLYVLVFIAPGRRQLVHVNVTANPTAAWVWRQLIEATPWGNKPRHLLRDRDVVYGRDFRERAQRIGIDAIATPVRSPRAKACASNCSLSVG